MAEAGAVSWQFTRKGYISIAEKVDQDELFLVAADAGADDVQFGEMTEIYTELENLRAVRQALQDAGIDIEEASVIYDPNNPVELGKPEALQVMNLIEKLEDADDVQSVYSTLDITDEVIAEMEKA
jgi:transcriptional/translational regulatory protein YebC/TACO1